MTALAADHEQTGICFSRVRRQGGSLSKLISADEQGRPVSESACAMTRGKSERVRLNGSPAAGLCAVIEGLESHDAIILGDHADGLPDEIRIAKDDKADPKSGTYGRTKDNFKFRENQPAWALLDFDKKAMPPEVRDRLADVGGFEAAVATLISGYDQIARVRRASTSAGLFNSETGDRFSGSGGLHLYLTVKDGSDIPRFLDALQKRAWLAGYGWIYVAGRGSLLIRSIIDVTVGSPERLVFEGPPNVIPPLAQDRDARKPVPYEGELLDTLAACPTLTSEKTRQFEALVTAAKREAKPEAEAAIEKSAEKIAQARGIDIVEARAVVRSSLDGKLTSHDLLEFHDTEVGVVSVADVLRDPRRFHEKLLADPIEGRQYGRRPAKLYYNADGSIIIYSYAHGRTDYRLHHDAAYIEAQVTAAGEGAPFLLASLSAHADKLPSLTRDRLLKLAVKLGQVNKTTVKETIVEEAEKAKADAAEAARERAASAPKPEGEPEPDAKGSKRTKAPEPELEAECERWNEQLHRTDRGEARDIIHNVTLILRIDDRFKGRLRWNQMLEAVEALGLPWRRTGGWAEWTDADDIYLAQWCQQRHAYVKRPTCEAAVQVVARDICHHPVRERLNGLKWDGTNRLETWLSTYLGVSSTKYSQEVGLRWLVSAVARAFKPGCKADHCLILEGTQGVGKSTAAAALALDDAWFADEIADLGTKDAGQDLRGKWIIELGELSALNRGAVERVKAFMSRRIDHYRPSYGTRSQDFPRQCVFIGSTNADAYLGDETGGRRFWPVKVGNIDIDALKRDREQLWAEAVASYRAGAQWWLDKETEQEARAEQGDRRIVDPWEWRILDWCAGQAEVTVTAALDDAIQMPADRQGQADLNRVARVLIANGFRRVRARRNGSLTWLYRRGVEQTEPQTGNVPTSTATTGNGKASVSTPVPSVPSVPSNSHTRVTAHTVPNISLSHVPTLRFQKSLGTTGNTGNTQPAWGALAYWRDRLGQCDSRDQSVSVVSDWLRAAGGEPTNDGTWCLPPDLSEGPALVDLKRQASQLGLMSKIVFTGIDLNDAAPQRQVAS